MTLIEFRRELAKGLIYNDKLTHLEIERRTSPRKRQSEHTLTRAENHAKSSDGAQRNLTAKSPTSNTLVEAIAVWPRYAPIVHVLLESGFALMPYKACSRGRKH